MKKKFKTIIFILFIVILPGCDALSKEEIQEVLISAIDEKYPNVEYEVVGFASKFFLNTNNVLNVVTPDGKEYNLKRAKDGSLSENMYMEVLEEEVYKEIINKYPELNGEILLYSYNADLVDMDEIIDVNDIFKGEITIRYNVFTKNNYSESQLNELLSKLKSSGINASFNMYLVDDNLILTADEYNKKLEKSENKIYEDIGFFNTYSEN